MKNISAHCTTLAEYIVIKDLVIWRINSRTSQTLMVGNIPAVVGAG